MPEKLQEQMIFLIGRAINQVDKDFAISLIAFAKKSHSHFVLCIAEKV